MSKYKFSFNCVWVIYIPTVSLYYFISGRLLALFDSLFVLALVVLFALYCLILYIPELNSINKKILDDVKLAELSDNSFE